MTDTQVRVSRAATPEHIPDLVDPDNGIVSRELFISDEVFRAETEMIFNRAWLFVAHESQIPNPGDYFQSRMGMEWVLVCRDDIGEIHVLLNSCRHRGMKVCRYDEGNTTEFTCPYHGWSFSTDGSLVGVPGELYGVPHFATYGGRLDKKEWGLVHVPQMHNYRGLIFATWDPEAPPFEQYMGDFHYWMDNLADSIGGVPGGAMAVRGVLKWRVKSNWKFVNENFLGDLYHGEPTHISVDMVGIGPGGMTAVRNDMSRHGLSREYLETERPSHSGETSFVKLGHGACMSIDTAYPPPWFEEPELTEYFADLYAKRTRTLEAEGKPLGGFGPCTLFPSMSFHGGGFPKSLLVAQPISATETEIWRWILVDRDAPEFVQDWMRRYYMRFSGPAGMTEQDDMENWDYASEASQGPIAKRYPYNYQLGLGMTKPDPLLKDAVVATTLKSEENARNYYRRWRDFVRGDSWAELMAE